MTRTDQVATEQEAMDQCVFRESINKLLAENRRLSEQDEALFGKHRAHEERLNALELAIASHAEQIQRTTATVERVDAVVETLSTTLSLLSTEITGLRDDLKRSNEGWERRQQANTEAVQSLSLLVSRSIGEASARDARNFRLLLSAMGVLAVIALFGWLLANMFGLEMPKPPMVVLP